MIFKCIFCKEIKDEKEKSPDHIIPETLGSNLTIDDVCKDCNTRILAKVDAKLVDSWFLRSERVIRGIKTKKGKTPTFDFGSMSVKNTKAKARYIVSKGSQNLKYWGKWREGDTIHLVFDGEDFLKADFEKIKKKYAEQGIKRIIVEVNTYKDPIRSKAVMEKVSQKLENLSGQIEIVDKGEFRQLLEGHFEISIYDYQQAIVKMAFEYAIMMLGEQYTFSKDAEILRSFILEEDLEKRKKIPLKGRGFQSFTPDDPLHNIYGINKDFHALIHFANTVWVYLFGKLWGIIYILDVNSTDIKKDWLNENSASILLINSLTKKCQEMSLWKYIQSLQENIEH